MDEERELMTLSISSRLFAVKDPFQDNPKPSQLFVKKYEIRIVTSINTFESFRLSMKIF